MNSTIKSGYPGESDEGKLNGLVAERSVGPGISDWKLGKGDSNNYFPEIGMIRNRHDPI